MRHLRLSAIGRRQYYLQPCLPCPVIYYGVSREGMSQYFRTGKPLALELGKTLRLVHFVCHPSRWLLVDDASSVVAQPSFHNFKWNRSCSHFIHYTLTSPSASNCDYIKVKSIMIGEISQNESLRQFVQLAWHLAAVYRRVSKYVVKSRICEAIESLVKSMVNLSNYALLFGIRLQ